MGLKCLTGVQPRTATDADLRAAWLFLIFIDLIQYYTNNQRDEADFE